MYSRSPVPIGRIARVGLGAGRLGTARLGPRRAFVEENQWYVSTLPSLAGSFFRAAFQATLRENRPESAAVLPDHTNAFPNIDSFVENELEYLLCCA